MKRAKEIISHKRYNSFQQVPYNHGKINLNMKLTWPAQIIKHTGE